MITYQEYLYTKVNRKRKQWLVFLILTLLLKVSIEYGYITELSAAYPLDISFLKIIYGDIWIIILYAGIPHLRRRASTLLLELFFFLQIIPLAVVYSMQNQSTLYFTMICISSFVCQEIIKNTKPVSLCAIRCKLMDWWIVFFTLLLILFLLYVHSVNGSPTLVALNIYKVYELRASGIYQMGKYMLYIQDILVFVVIPIIIIWCVHTKRIVAAVIIYISEFIIYLYTGHKSYFITGATLLIVSIWSMRENFISELRAVILVGFSILGFFAKFPIIKDLYGLFIRRELIVSATNKFLYYDYFKSRPKEGLAGIFPRWLINIRSNYGTGKDHFSYIIARTYYKKEDMQSNTGFLAEGYWRFGLLGILFIMVIYAILLRMVDDLQKRTSLSFAFCVGIPLVLYTQDGQLLNNLIFGPLIIWVVFVLFYRNNVLNNKEILPDCNSNKRLTIKCQ